MDLVDSMRALVRFLWARLDEIEERHVAGWWDECKVCRVPAPCWHERDAEAKRLLIAEFWDSDEGLSTEHMAPDATRAVLRHLALPYADHPNYLPEWKP